MWGLLVETQALAAVDTDCQCPQAQQPALLQAAIESVGFVRGKWEKDTPLLQLNLKLLYKACSRTCRFDLYFANDKPVFSEQWNGVCFQSSSTVCTSPLASCLETFSSCKPPAKGKLSYSSHSTLSLIRQTALLEAMVLSVNRQGKGVFPPKNLECLPAKKSHQSL